MRHPPRAQLTHDCRFVRDRQFLGPLSVNAEAITAAGKWQVEHFEREPLSGLVVYERERVMSILRWGHVSLLAKANQRDQP
jgi:hypothetical protein